MTTTLEILGPIVDAACNNTESRQITYLDAVIVINEHLALLAKLEEYQRCIGDIERAIENEDDLYDHQIVDRICARVNALPE